MQKIISRKWNNQRRDSTPIVFAVLCTTFIIGSNAGLPKTIERKIVRRETPDLLVGLTMQDEKDPPLFYDTFYPIIFEVNYSPLNTSKATLDIPKNISGSWDSAGDQVDGLLCAANGSTSAPSSQSSYSNPFDLPIPLGLNGTSFEQWQLNLCPIKQKLDDLISQLLREMQIFEAFNASVSKLDSHFKSCHDIKPHFSNHIIDPLEMELYFVQIILDCPMSDLIHAKITIPPLEKGKYEEIFQLFIETYIMPRFRLFGFPKYAIPTNTLLALQSTFLFNSLLEAYQWTAAIDTCNAQRIPRLLIPQKLLLNYLTEIQGKVASKGYSLSIPPSDISNYYKMKLADCVMTTDNDYIIRILVPLKKAAANYRLINIKSIPFLNMDSMSSKTTICHHRTIEGSFIVDGEDHKMTPIHQTDQCESAQLCRVPSDGERGLFSKCIRSSFMNSTEGMLENCRMSCIHYDYEELPYIKRIRSDQFVIAGNVSNENLTVVCKRDDPVPVEGVPEDIGSLLLTLPCACHLLHKSVRYEVNGPCEFTMEFRPIKPRGYTYDTLLDHYFHHRLLNISKSIAKAIVNNSDGGEYKAITPIFMDDGSEGDGEKSYQIEDSPPCPVWPLYFAYVLLLVIVVILVFGFYVLRNVYVRVGQIEMSNAMTPTQGSGVINPRRYQNGPQYHRNAPVTFNVRDTFPPGNDHAY